MVRTLVASLVLLGAASSARAIPEFPGELQKVTGAPCLPHCNVCHRDDNAGFATVDRPFGLALHAHGMGESLYSLDKAVSRLEKAGTDSDGDGIGDIEELSQGDDPNTSYPASICGPKVGCSLQNDASSNAGLAAPLLLLFWWLQRRARSAQA